MPSHVRLRGLSGTPVETEVLIARDELPIFFLHTKFIREFSLFELLDPRPRSLPEPPTKNLMGGSDEPTQ
jgi:hypothetical protein